MTAKNLPIEFPLHVFPVALHPDKDTQPIEQPNIPPLPFQQSLPAIPDHGILHPDTEDDERHTS